MLRLTFRGRRVVAATLAPARIDERGVPVPATGGTAARIAAKFDRPAPLHRPVRHPGRLTHRASRSARNRIASG